MSESSLIACIGLGNPGAEYAQTRHNAGFWFVDRLCVTHKGQWRTESKFHGELARIRAGKQEVLLLKPSTFMNRSGRAAQALAQFYKLAPEQLLVAHDELDLAPGDVRLKLGGGHGGHNGLRDLHAQLGEGYRRLRIGIGHPGHKDLVLNYVLGRPSRSDADLMDAALLRAEQAVTVWLDGHWDRALKQLHTA